MDDIKLALLGDKEAIMHLKAAPTLTPLTEWGSNNANKYEWRTLYAALRLL